MQTVEIERRGTRSPGDQVLPRAGLFHVLEIAEDDPVMALLSLIDLLPVGSLLVKVL
jgi:hypothetical protein